MLQTAIDLFRHHAGVFLSVTLLVVAPLAVLVDGVWGGDFHNGSHGHEKGAAASVSVILASLVIPAFVTSMHAVIVRDMGNGIAPDARRALREAGPRLPAALGAVALYTTGVLVGFLLIIIPGIWLAIRWYFAAQSAVLDGSSPREALQRSDALVRDRWWEVFGCVIASGILFGGAGALVGLALDHIYSGLVYVILHALVEAVTASLTALFGTLLFFSLRVRPVATRTR